MYEHQSECLPLEPLDLLTLPCLKLLLSLLHCSDNLRLSICLSLGLDLRAESSELLLPRQCRDLAPLVQCLASLEEQALTHDLLQVHSMVIAITVGSPCAV